MKLIIKLLISTVLLYLVLLRVDFDGVLGLVNSYSSKVIVLGTLLQFSALVIAAFKWRIFVPEFSFNKILRFTFVGQFYSLVLPGQFLGEMAKAYRFSKGEEGRERLIASVAMDKITGIAGLLFVAVIGMLFTKTELLGNWKMVIIIALIAVLAGIFSFRFESVRSLVVKYLPFQRSITPFVGAYHEYAKNTALIVRTVFLGILFQLIAIWITIVIAHSLGIDISLFDWFWIFSLVSVAVFVPVTIGGLGVREGIFVGLLGFFAVPPAEAVVLSLSIFALQVLAGSIGGIFEAWHWFRSQDKIKNIVSK